jgi:hemerythrin-like domain-containing protein
MRPTEILVAEHRIIERVLECLTQMAERATDGRGLDVQGAAAALDFLRTFADGCHHGKEERHLFEALIAKGWPRDRGPVGMMFLDHDEGRALIRRMDAARQAAEAGAAEAAAEFASAARAYVDLLRAHIHKEDRVLFPLADQALSAEEQEALLAAFDRTESQEMGTGTHERMLGIARELSARFGLSLPAREATGGCGHCSSGHEARG